MPMTKDQYVALVRKALNDNRVTEMSKEETLDAYEELHADLEGMIDAIESEIDDAGDEESDEEG